MKKILHDLNVIWIISLAVHGLWVGLEQLIYNEVQTRTVDNFIGLLLIWSLYRNYAHWREKGKSDWREKGKSDWREKGKSDWREKGKSDTGWRIDGPI